MTRPLSRRLRLSDHSESKHSKWSWAAYTLVFGLSLNAIAHPERSFETPDKPSENKTIHGSIDFEIDGRNDGGVHINYVAGEAPQTIEEQSAFEQQSKAIADAIGAPLEEIKFSKELEAAADQRAEKYKKWASLTGVPVTPRTSADRSAGFLWGTIGGVTTALVWYPHHGLLLGTSATLWSVLVGYYFNAYHITLDDLFLKGITNIERKLTQHYLEYSLHDIELAQLSHEERLKKAEAFAKRDVKLLYYARLLLFDFTVTHVGNVVGGMQKSFIQTTVDIALLMGLQNIHGVQRNNLLRENRALRHTYQLITKPLISFVRALQDSNKTGLWFSVGAYPITHSLAASLGIYLSLIAINAKAPKMGLKVVKETNKGIQKLGESMVGLGNRLSKILAEQAFRYSSHDVEWAPLTEDERLKATQTYSEKLVGWISNIGNRLVAMGVVAEVHSKPRDCKDIADTSLTNQFSGEVDIP